jgi:hypothetical protein
VFFDQQTVPSLRAAVDAFESRLDRFVPANCRQNAERFSIERFRAEFGAYVEQKRQDFERARHRWD